MIFLDPASEVNALVNPTAFIVTGVPFQFRTIPGLARNFERRGFGGDAVALATGSDSGNDGVRVSGADVLEAFDRLEVLESTSDVRANITGHCEHLHRTWTSQGRNNGRRGFTSWSLNRWRALRPATLCMPSPGRREGAPGVHLYSVQRRVPTQPGVAR
jgi:hypothetical protein